MMPSMTRALLTLLLSLLPLEACGDDGGGGDGIGPLPAFVPSRVGPSATPAGMQLDQTEAETRARADAIMRRLTAPRCWDASKIVDSRFGDVGLIQIFWFDVTPQGYTYTYEGFSRWGGPITGFRGTGTFQGHDMIFMSTWTGRAEAFALIGPDILGHFTEDREGRATVVYYAREEASCL
jgi:hypothetical protein